jgi:hypothetical protein
LENANCIDKYELGKLKKEGYGSGSFYAPKFYDFDNERKIKGIKKKTSILLNENNNSAEYQIEIWKKLKSDLKEGNLNKQIIITDTKTIRKIYEKGKVKKNGVVVPYSYKEILAK